MWAWIILGGIGLFALEENKRSAAAKPTPIIPQRGPLVFPPAPVPGPTDPVHPDLLGFPMPDFPLPPLSPLDPTTVLGGGPLTPSVLADLITRCQQGDQEACAALQGQNSPPPG